MERCQVSHTCQSVEWTVLNTSQQCIQYQSAKSHKSQSLVCWITYNIKVPSYVFPITFILYVLIRHYTYILLSELSVLDVVYDTQVLWYQTTNVNHSSAISCSTWLVVAVVAPAAKTENQPFCETELKINWWKCKSLLPICFSHNVNRKVALFALYIMMGL